MSKENHGVFVFFNEAELKASLERAQQQAAKLQRQMEDVGDKSSPKFLQLQQQLDNTNKKIETTEKRISGQLAPSIRQMEAAVRKAYNEMQNLPIGSPEWKAKVAEFDKLNDQFTKLKTNVGSVGKIMESFGSQVKTVAAGVLIGNTVESALQTVQSYFSGIVQNAAKVSDELADIQKTTGLTNVEVKALNAELSKINTRTGISELRQIAAVGGQFNVAKKDLAAFVEAVDKANVALGDEFGGEAENVAEQLSKLRNIFTDVKSDKIDKDLLNIGNALNSLGNAGVATSDVVADFANRIAGVGIPLGLTTGQVLGISATLQELGVSAERGGTAVSKILQKMTTNTGEFAKVAGVSLQEFTKLVNTDLYKAFQLVVEGSQKSGASATAMANLLKDAELSGAGAAEVFLKLGGNAQLMGQKVDLASSSLQNTDSILQEFNAKNNNVAANLEKIQKYVAGLFSGLSDAAGTFINNVAGLINVQEDEVAALQKTGREMEINLIALQDTNLSSEARKQLIQETNDKYGEYLPRLITEKDTLADINQLQQESNKLMLVKILQISYQKELTKILEEQKVALENYVQTQISLSKSGEVAQDIGLSPGQLKTQQQVLKNFSELNKKTFDDTGLNIEKLRDKFKQMAAAAGIAFDDILNASEKTKTGIAEQQDLTGLGIQAVNDEIIKGREALLAELSKLENESYLAGLSANEREIEMVRQKYEALTERAKKYGVDVTRIQTDLYNELYRITNEQFAKESDAQYKQQLAQLQLVFGQAKIIIKKQYADGILTKQEYDEQINQLDLAYLQGKMQIADQEKQISKAAADDLQKFKEQYANAELDQQIANNNKRIADAKRTEDEITQAAKEAAQMRNQIRDQSLQFAVQALQGFGQITSNIENAELARSKRADELKAESYKRQLDKKQISQAQYDAFIDNQKKEQDKKQRELAKKQFERDRALRITMAIINTAAAVMQALGNLPPPASYVAAAAAGVSGAIQIGVISTEPAPEFEQGGKLLNGPSHKSPSKGLHIINPETGQTVALAEGNEWIINKNSSGKYHPLLEAVNNDDEAAINQWFMNRPRANLTGQVQQLHHYQMDMSNIPVYNDERLRRTVHNGFVESSKHIVTGIVSGISAASYSKSRML